MQLAIDILMYVFHFICSPGPCAHLVASEARTKSKLEQKGV